MPADLELDHVVSRLSLDLLIGGERRTASDGGEIDVIDPSNRVTIASVAAASAGDVQDAIEAARQAQIVWWSWPHGRRAEVLNQVAALIRRDAALLAHVESLDTGKPLAQARTDVEVAAQYFSFYAGLADKLYGSTIPLGPRDFAATFREPLGVTGHIVPWNYPLQISARTVAPSLAAGNAAVLKPAEEAPLTALLLGAIVDESGAPPGLLNVVPGLGAIAGAALAGDDGIDHLSFTGGEVAGRLVMAALGRNLKPSTMELGGKSPSLVFQDADLDRAIPVLTRALIQNSGQTCSAGSRVIVHRSRHDELVGRLAEAFRQVRLGSGWEDLDMGPVISGKQYEQVLTAIADARQEGAELVTGGPLATASATAGHLPEASTSGWYVHPTLLTEVSRRMDVAQKEVFGPVLCVLAVDSEDEAVDVANGTEFGLIASVWTGSVDRAARVGRRLHCGQVYVNSYGAGGGVALPFGGVRKSGFGREKGVEAAYAYTQTKVIAFSVEAREGP